MLLIAYDYDHEGEKRESSRVQRFLEILPWLNLTILHYQLTSGKDGCEIENTKTVPRESICCIR